MKTRCTAVITGATSGVGRQVALSLAAESAHLELLGRDVRRGAEVVSRIRRLNQDCCVRFFPVELSDFDGVRDAATRIAFAHDAIDVLVNNAGARNDRFSATVAGIEGTFAANHLGHFLLTGLLLDRLVRARQGRVINVSSSSHFGATSADEWILHGADYDRRQAYARSKLANVMFTYELARRMRGTRVTSVAIDPGSVASRFAGNNGPIAWAKHVVSHALRRDLISAVTAAEHLARLATAPEFASVTGRYYRGGRETMSSPASYDAKASSQLWSLSVHLTGLNATNCRAWSLVQPFPAV